MARSPHSKARLLSVVAATVIALACGTNYAYSAWAPQFAHKLKLSATESNLIGTFGNLGMYATGVPGGMMVDTKGPRWGVALGTVLFGLGYYPIAKAYQAGPDTYSVAVLCLFSFFTGSGSASAFTAAIKTAALNFPDSRGTATAFPLAAFGLSAFFFSTVALAFHGDTAGFLYLLAFGTVLMPIFSFPFLRVLPHGPKEKASEQERRPLHRRKSSTDPRTSLSNEETGAHTNPADQTRPSQEDPKNVETGEETSSLLSRSSSESRDLDIVKDTASDKIREPPHLDIRGFALLPHLEFWQLFAMLGLLTGIGLMTINNIGNNAEALWLHFDPDADDDFVAKKQVMHVSVISVGSFSGRLLSGIGSDILVSRYNRSRFWCLLGSTITFSIAQLLATSIENPNYLTLVSGFTGLAYGVLFGVYPSLIAHTFGVHGLSQNWGTMCLAPVISGNIFNILYGKIYDSHSTIQPDGDRECTKGVSCYAAAYHVTFFAALVGIAVCIWSIWHENKVHKKNESDSRGHHERIA